MMMTLAFIGYFAGLLAILGKKRKLAYWILALCLLFSIYLLWFHATTNLSSEIRLT